MSGEINLELLLRRMAPKLNKGEYVFLSIKDLNTIDRNDTIFEFKEHEGTTIVMERNKADALRLTYEFIASWITLQIHSSLESVGLTALFSTELSNKNISCNVVAGYYHDHIFVNKSDTEKAIAVLTNLSKSYKPLEKK